MKPSFVLFIWVSLAWGGLPPYFQSITSGSHPLPKLQVRFESDGSGNRYVARGPNFSLSISPAESRLLWVDSQAAKRTEVRTRLLGVSPAATMEPAAPLSGSLNYFTGPSSGWRANVKSWERIRCRDAYPGIDMVFHGNPGELEYDFVVKPHADPNLIRLELSGQQALSLDAKGDLVVTTAAGAIHWKHPEVYQDIAGVRHSVNGKFVVSKRGIVRFTTGEYDHNHDLVIDPTLAYSTYLGGSANEEGKAIAVDGAGNVYIVGETDSPNLPVLSAFQSSLAGQSAGLGASGDVFVAKFNPAGALVYLTYLGGTGNDCPTGVAVDASGNAYIAGYTTSPDFPIAGTNPIQSRYGGANGAAWYHTGDAFVTKLSPSGNKLIYSTYLGGSGDDAATSIAVDSAGDAYIAGGAGANFPTTAGAYQTSLKGGGGEPIEPAYGAPFLAPGDAFAAEIDPTGSKLIFSTLVGGGFDDMAVALALDASANVYIAGYTMSPNFPTTAGALQKSWGGADPQTPYFVTGDGFITKLNPTGSALIYSTYFGGSGDECITGIAVDSTGSVYFTGWSSTMNLPTTPGAAQSKYGGYQILPFLIEYLFGDAIVGKLNPAGSQLTYLTYLGGNTNEAALAIAIDSAGDAFVAGFTDSTNFPTSAGAAQTTMHGDNGPTPPYILFGDGFLTEINPTGTAIMYSTYFGGRGDDMFQGIALDGAGKVYLTGVSVSVDWPVTSGASQAVFGGYLANGWPWGDAVYTVFSGFTNAPSITKVANAEGEGAAIAANTWTEIKGSGLSATTRIWQAADFVNNQMPTKLDGVSVTINGQNAYVYYISPSQINVLTPPGLTAGQPSVVVTVNGTVSAAFTATVQSTAPSFFIFGAGPYVVATHLNGGIIGPTSLYPGSSTPAAGGETIIVYANGFGPVTPPVVVGSATQSGNLPTLPVIRIGSTNANVRFAGLVSPGLYQFNVDVPPGTPSGDNAISATFNGTTQAGTMITIQ